jgi:hypothetical protein
LYLDKDCFSSSQIHSKIWLAETLETVLNENPISHPLSILVLGGWYGLLNFIIRSKNKIPVSRLRSLDIDPIACEYADIVNEAWLWKEWEFKSICADANQYEYTFDDYNVIINSSVEHIETDQWFLNIPNNAIVVLQSNNMPHDDHSRNHNTLDEFIKDFPMSKILYQGEKLFEYPDWKFSRFMIIGIK